MLLEHDYYTGDKNHERVSYSYGSYGADNVPEVRTDYTYKGRALEKVSVFDIKGRALDSKDVVEEIRQFEGVADQERIKSINEYYDTGEILKETLNTYAENLRGVYYLLNSTETTYSSDKEMLERVEKANDISLSYEGSLGQDLNGNIRKQNIKTYLFSDGVQKLSTEEDILYSQYKALSQAGEERHLFYSYDDSGMQVPLRYEDIYNHAFNTKGGLVSQTVEEYTVSEDAVDTISFGSITLQVLYEKKKEINNQKFDYLDNIVDRTEEVWQDRAKTQLSYLKVTHSDYDNNYGRRRGNASFTTISRYTSLEKTDASKIDVVESKTTGFDAQGNIARQEADTYVMDALTDPNSPQLKQVSRKDTKSYDMDARGNAKTQDVTTYRTDETGNFILDAGNKMVATNFQVFKNRQFDAQHNVVNQESLTYDQEGGTLLDVQVMRSIGFSPTGVSLKQIIATYNDEAKTSLLDVQVVENSDISSSGDIGKSVTTKYAKADIVGTANGRIAYSEPIDRKEIRTSSFDLRGNAMKQEIFNEYWDNSQAAFVFSEAQKIENGTYNFHDRLTDSVVWNYNDKALTDLSNQQKVSYQSFDDYGNVLDQKIDTFVPDELTKELSFEDHKVIENKYNNAVARRRGNASETISSKYNAKDEVLANLTERTVTTNDNFDARGYAANQDVKTYVKDLDNSVKLASDKVMENTEINNRGDAIRQNVTVYNTDDSGNFILDSSTGERVAANYQMVNNREFDADHNAKNQVIYTYDKKDGALLDVQEIRASDGFYNSGVARKQVIATFSDADEKSLLDVKVVLNKKVTSSGNIKESVTTRFAAVKDGVDLKGNLSEKDFTEIVSRETTSVAEKDFDARGNALKQNIYKETWDDLAKVFTLTESRVINNDAFNFHDRTSHTVISTYRDMEHNEKIDKQDIFYDAYDQYGNVLKERINTYLPDAVTQELLFSDFKTIDNIYGNAVAARRGNASNVVTKKFSKILTSGDDELSYLVDRTVTDTTLFNNLGYAVEQNVKTYVVDRLTDATNPVENLATLKNIHNDEISNRGDAILQKITSFETDNRGWFLGKDGRFVDKDGNIFDETGATVGKIDGLDKNLDLLSETSYQVIENRAYDLEHNVKDQKVLSYDKSGAGNILLDVQEIKNDGFHSSGVALKQIIVTYIDAAETGILNVKEVQNLEIKSNGNVGKSVVRSFEGLNEGVAGAGVIAEADLSGPVDEQTITYTDYDLRGNALHQVVNKSYYDEDLKTYTLRETQDITNTGYDIHDRVKTSTVVNTSIDGGVSVFADKQVINYSSYDRFGNSLEQIVQTYMGTDAETASLNNSKVILNAYSNVLGARRGTTSSTVVTKNDVDGNLVDKTTTVTTQFDVHGYAAKQETVTEVWNNAANKLEESNKKTVWNENIDSRGDAQTQYVLTEDTDKDGKLEVVNYQAFTNRKFRLEFFFKECVNFTFYHDRV
ncbi:MAG: hypothetical protein HQL28_01410, partial [Candidatus Omnitrophica bacterium]|nr:hypothetical protein [Candidatus Omnitrophota bacterium]